MELSLAEDMAIRKDEWTEIERKIAASADTVRPHGWGKAIFLLKEWGVLSVTITLIVTLIAGVFIEWSAANLRFANESTFETDTRDRLTQIDNQMVSLRALVAANQPLRKPNQDAARELLAQARRKSIPPIPAPVVEQAGMSFIEAARTDTGAWKVALEFASYRTVLNGSARPPGSEHTLTPLETTWYALKSVPGKPAPALNDSSHVRLPISQSARAEQLGNPIPQTANTGPAWLFVNGGAVSLDEAYIRRAVFNHVEVYYSGKPVQLEDTIFIDCTFVFDNSEQARQLGTELLSSATVTFRTKA
jgi:hypothetical protein